MTKKEKVYLITFDNKYKRRGEPAEILGIKKLTFKDDNSETSVISYWVVYENGLYDYIDKEIADREYRFVTLSDMLKYGTP
jgi:hypothetical protein